LSADRSWQRPHRSPVLTLVPGYRAFRSEAARAGKKSPPTPSNGQIGGACIQTQRADAAFWGAVAQAIPSFADRPGAPGFLPELVDVVGGGCRPL
jgi:hypothetical protein